MDLPDAVWFVAGDLEGPGLDGDDEIGVWSVSGSFDAPPDGAPQVVLSANALAAQFPDWFEAESTDFDVSRENDGFDEVQECLEDALG